MLLLKEDEVSADGRVSLSGPRAEKLLRDVGVVSGMKISVGIVNGHAGSAEVLATGPGHVELACGFDGTPTPGASGITLLLAPPRPKVMKRLWAPLSALGVERIVLTMARGVRPEYTATHWLLREHFEPLLFEGLEQSCRTVPPIVSFHSRFQAAIDELGPPAACAARLMADPSAEIPLLDAVSPRASNVVLAVGPETGWAGGEREIMIGSGFAPCCLGHHPQRTDVACLALLGAVAAALQAGGRQRNPGPT